MDGFRIGHVRYVCPSEPRHGHTLISSCIFAIVALVFSITCFRGVGSVGGKAEPAAVVDQEEASGRDV